MTIIQIIIQLICFESEVRAIDEIVAQYAAWVILFSWTRKVRAALR